MGFFPEEARTHFRKQNPYSLEAIISEFPVKAKKAMYAAAEKGGLKTGTWVNCGWNAAGKMIDEQVSSTSAAATAFGVPESLVTRFIHMWDGFHMGSPALSELLKSAILTVGIAVPPEDLAEQRKTGVVVYTGLVYKGAQTKFLEELAAAETPADLGITDEEMAAAAAFVDELVSA